MGRAGPGQHTAEGGQSVLSPAEGSAPHPPGQDVLLSAVTRLQEAAAHLQAILGSCGHVPAVAAEPSTAGPSAGSRKQGRAQLCCPAPRRLQGLGHCGPWRVTSQAATWAATFPGFHLESDTTHSHGAVLGSSQPVSGSVSCHFSAASAGI